MKKEFNILVICDPQLQNEIETIIEALEVKASIIPWQKGFATESTEAAWQDGKNWDVLFSVYSEYILSQHALDRIRIPLNIHPALPNNPGVGYDVYPLINGEKKCGATIHWMEKLIDHGVVLESKAINLLTHATYPLTRKLNQAAVISLFEKWFTLASSTSKRAFYEHLQVQVNQGRGWTGPCVSKSTRRLRLLEFQSKHSAKWDRLKIPPSLIERSYCI